MLFKFVFKETSNFEVKLMIYLGFILKKNG